MKIRKITASFDPSPGLMRAVLIAVLGVGLGGFLVLIGFFIYFTRDLPKIHNILEYQPPIVTVLYDDRGEPFAEYYLQRREIVAPELIPVRVKQAFVAAEDSSFYQHEGISLGDILRALWVNIRERRIVQGGSTITQQVAKTLLLSPERKLTRKIREAILAYRIERNLTKDEILSIYLNQIYFGQGAYGIKAAAEAYFDKSYEALDLAEIAFLAGLPRAPNSYSPYSHPERAKERQIYVLNRMVEEGYLALAESAQIREQPLSFRRSHFPRIQAPYFAEHFRRELQARYGDEKLYQEGLRVYTTMNLDMQLAAEESLRKGLRELDKRQGYRGPLRHLPPEEYEAFIGQEEKNIREANSSGIFALRRSRPGGAYTIEALPAPEPFRLTEDETYHGLVTKVDSRNDLVEVKVGPYPGVIHLKDMKWARKPDPDAPGATISYPSHALTEGDVILVRKKEMLPDPGPGEPQFVFSLEQEPLAEGAMVVIEPDTGFVRAMVGGYDYRRSEFNRVIQAMRQPGSAFKPIFYAAALENGYTPATIVIDSPMIYEDPETALLWRPKNYGERFFGPISLRKALAKSVNNVSIRLLQDIGIDTAINFAHRLGIEAELAEDLSLALGSSAMAPMELVKAYAVFANRGKKVHPIFVKEIRDREGTILEQNLSSTVGMNLGAGKHFLSPFLSGEELSPQIWSEEAGMTDSGTQTAGEGVSAPGADRAVDEDIAFLITYLLEGVIRHGTGWRARVLNRPVAGKTGTSNDNKDAWFLGYTPNLVVGVWVGFDDERPLGRFETGSRAASPIWVDFMKKVLGDKPSKDFVVPPGIVFAKIDPETGLLATPETENPVFEAFEEGTEPKFATPPKDLAPEDDFYRLDLE